MTKIDEIRKPESTEEKRFTEQESRDYVIEFEKKRSTTMEQASKYVEAHNEKIEQKSEPRKTVGTELSETEPIESNEELEPIEKLKEMIEELEGFDKVVEKKSLLDIEQYRYIVNTGKHLTEHLEKTPHLLNLEEFDRFVDTGKQFISNLEAMEQSDVSKVSEVTETELHEPLETQKPADKIRGVLGKLDDIWTTIEDHPEILTEDLYQVLTKLGKQYTKNLERIEHAVAPQQDTEWSEELQGAGE